MGLFKKTIYGEGPGVEKDAPKKKGAARFMEILLRDGVALLCGNVFLCVAAIPGALGVALGLSAGALAPALVAGALGGALMAPCLCGLNDMILRSLRDEAGFWWYNYKKQFAANAKASLLPGAVSGVLVTAQLAALMNMLQGSAATAVTMALLLLGLVLTGLIQVYLWPQLVLMELPFVTMVKNSLLLSFAFPKRSVPAMLVTLVYWGAMLGLMPLSLFVMPLLGFWYISLVSLMLVYPNIDRTFHIEEKIRQKKEAEWAEQPSMYGDKE